MTKLTVKDLAAALAAKYVGDGEVVVSATAEPQDAGPTDLAIATTPAYQKRLSEGAARAALLGDLTDWHAGGLEAAIVVDRPRFAMAGLSAIMDHHWRSFSGIHPTAHIDPSAQVGEGCTIGAFCVIGAGVKLGDNAWLSAHVSVQEGACIGHDATIFDGVKIGHDVKIGDRFIAQPGAVIGADGFSFVTPEKSTIENVRESLGDAGDAVAQSFARIHSLGSVTIGDDVELGANSCIDRGTIRDTTVGNGCKFDNLAQVGHNVQIGNDCLICAQVGIAGSSRIGNNVVLGGQTGISDNVFVGDNAITGGATKVLANVPAGRIMLGYPAMKMEAQLGIYKSLRRLPKLIQDVATLKSSISKSDKSP